MFVLVLISYPAWEYYWYSKVGLAFIKWHTHLAAYLYLWLAGAFCYSALNKVSLPGKTKNYFLLFSTVLVSFFLIEMYFIFSGANKTQAEKDFATYKSFYVVPDKGHYHVWPVTSNEHWIIKPEFKVWRPTNSIGLPDYEWPKSDSVKVKRIMAIGDSFTEGDGAPYDSSYVALLKSKLNAEGDSFYLMNAGVCGSDPFNNYILYKDKLFAYRPNLIIQTLATNDLINDIIIRGGMERFLKDGAQKFHPAPWWEPVYACSYISRLFFQTIGYNELLVKDKLNPDEEKKLNDEVISLFKQYASLCAQNNTRLVVALYPDKTEVNNHQYRYNFSSILKSLKEDDGIEVIDLLPAYIAYAAKNNTNPEKYFWVIDGHLNPKGYKMMADCIYYKMMPLLAAPATTK